MLVPLVVLVWPLAIPPWHNTIKYTSHDANATPPKEDTAEIAIPHYEQYFAIFYGPKEVCSVLTYLQDTSRHLNVFVMKQILYHNKDRLYGYVDPMV